MVIQIYYIKHTYVYAKCLYISIEIAQHIKAYTHTHIYYIQYTYIYVYMYVYLYNA